MLINAQCWRQSTAFPVFKLLPAPCITTICIAFTRIEQHGIWVFYCAFLYRVELMHIRMSQLHVERSVHSTTIQQYLNTVVTAGLSLFRSLVRSALVRGDLTPPTLLPHWTCPLKMPSKCFVFIVIFLLNT